MTLLDIGCGWGATINRAVEKYDVNVIGLTLSENQKRHIEQHWFANSTSDRKMDVRLQPWEDFSGKVDRIVSIGAFEHFGFNKYDDYFKKTYDWMPDDGVQMLHTIVIPEDEEIKAKKLPLTMSRVRFIKFIMDEIYPGGRLPLASMVKDARGQGRLHGHPRAAPAAALRQDAGHLGGQPRGQEGRGHRDHQRGDLRAVPQVPDGLRRPVPRGLHRRRPIHLREGADSRRCSNLRTHTN